MSLFLVFLRSMLKFVGPGPSMNSLDPSVTERTKHKILSPARDRYVHDSQRSVGSTHHTSAAAVKARLKSHGCARILHSSHTQSPRVTDCYATLRSSTAVTPFLSTPIRGTDRRACTACRARTCRVRCRQATADAMLAAPSRPGELHIYPLFPL